MTIPTLQRTLIEKTCRENGWEIISDSCDEETVLCSSSFLSEKASIEIFDDTAYKIRFTDVLDMVKQRVGQEKYREALMKYWQGKCAVTDCSVNEVLRASHAKPWKDCSSDRERLDVYNGFLLIANLDALFDKGLISFTDDGVIMISSEIEETMYSSLGLNASMRLRWIDEKHLTYLKYHRDNIFRNH